MKEFFETINAFFVMIGGIVALFTGIWAFYTARLNYLVKMEKVQRKMGKKQANASSQLPSLPTTSTASRMPSLSGVVKQYFPAVQANCMWMAAVILCLVGVLALGSVVLGTMGEGAVHVIQLGRSDRVRSIAFHPDGKHLLAHNDACHYWHLPSLTRLKVISKSGGTINHSVFLPDGKHVALQIGNPSSREVHLWDCEADVRVDTLMHEASVWSIAFSADGTMMACRSGRDRVCLWDLSSRTLLRTYTGFSGYVNAIGFSADGKTLISGGDDCTVRLWSVRSGVCVSKFQEHTKSILDVAINQNSDLVASAAEDGVHLRKISTKEYVRHWNGKCFALVFTPDGKSLVMAQEDSLSIWDVVTGKCLRWFRGHTARITALAVSPDGRYLASGGHDATIRVWKLP